MTCWDDILLGMGPGDGHGRRQEAADRHAGGDRGGDWYQKIMRESAPPGVIGFNWNECQTTFMQGRAAMWWDGIGFSAPMLDPNKSKVVGKVGFAPIPPAQGATGRRSSPASASRAGEEQAARLAVHPMGDRASRS